MSRTVIVVEIDGCVQRDVFYVRNYAIRWAKKNANGKPWRVLLMEEREVFAEGDGTESV